MDVNRLQREREDVLRQVYEAAEADPGHVIRFKEQITGYDAETLARHILVLSERGFVNQVSMGFLAITPEGRQHVEDLRAAEEAAEEAARAAERDERVARRNAILYNPWLVGIGVTVIGGVILAIVLALFT
jgi:hypothetical protein